MTQDELEALVDELGLVSVVSLLANIWHNKGRQTLCLKGQGANPYTAWNSNGFLLKQLMTRLRPINSYDRDLDLKNN
ncbi:hypothetical protein QUA81_06615 [Microcoleus sp. F6_B4]